MTNLKADTHTVVCRGTWFFVQIRDWIIGASTCLEHSSLNACDWNGRACDLRSRPHRSKICPRTPDRGPRVISVNIASRFTDFTPHAARRPGMQAGRRAGTPHERTRRTHTSPQDAHNTGDHRQHDTHTLLSQSHSAALRPLGRERGGEICRCKYNKHDTTHTRPKRGPLRAAAGAVLSVACAPTPADAAHPESASRVCSRLRSGRHSLSAPCPWGCRPRRACPPRGAGVVDAVRLYTCDTTNRVVVDPVLGLPRRDCHQLLRGSRVDSDDIVHVGLGHPHLHRDTEALGGARAYNGEVG